MSTDLIVKKSPLRMLSLPFFLLILLSFPSSTLSSELSKELLVEHSARPLQAESTLEALEPWETPISGFFIRSHFGEPTVDASRWVLTVDGLVDKPLTLTLKDLQKLGRKSIHAVLECSGNGRAQQKPIAAGVPWMKGAVGNAEWGGVPLSELLALAGVQPTARFARIEGADKPAFPSVPGFIRSVPLEKLQQESTLVSWMMNREPMPLLYGGPLRLILPGWYGENWIKWLTHITLTEKEDSGFFMKKAYRIPKAPIQPGEPWDSSTGQPINTLLVQSILIHPKPGQTLLPGDFTVRGKAFSGDATISKVEISTDLGNTWELAKVEAPHPSGGWQEFQKTVQITQPGLLQVWSRATDSQGHQQPFQHQWNPGGYLRNAVDSVEVKVALDTSPGKALFKLKCLTCHTVGLIESQRLTPKQWENVLKKMEGFGVKLEDLEKKWVLGFLEQYSPQLSPTPPKLRTYSSAVEQFNRPMNWRSTPFKRGAQIFAKNCALCHGPQAEGKIGPRLRGRAIPAQEFISTVSNGKNAMPPFGTILKPQEIREVYDYTSGNPIIRYKP